MGRCIYLRKGEVHTPPVVGVKAGDLPIGQSVKLMEGGVETEFIVVNQGIPENSSLYDASCNGTWLLRKDIKNTSVWNSTNTNVYETSTVNTWLNSTYFNSLGTIEQTAIKQIKIPYRSGTGSGDTDKTSGNGLSTKVFLLDIKEVDGSTNRYYPDTGAILKYFEGISNATSSLKRIAYLNGVATGWWTRAPYLGDSYGLWLIATNGGVGYSDNANDTRGIRPALIIPSTSIFDPTTYLLKK